MSYLSKAIEIGLININSIETKITYINELATKDFTNPEEKVRAELYSELIIEYNYPKELIGLEVPIKIGSSKSRRIDIVIFENYERTNPYIIIECKKSCISNYELSEAIEQCFSYCNVWNHTPKYLIISSGIDTIYYSYDKRFPLRRDKIAEIPKYNATNNINSIDRNFDKLNITNILYVLLKSLETYINESYVGTDKRLEFIDSYDNNFVSNISLIKNISEAIRPFTIEKKFAKLGYEIYELNFHLIKALDYTISQCLKNSYGYLILKSNNEFYYCKIDKVEINKKLIRIEILIDEIVPIKYNNFLNYSKEIESFCT